MNLFCKQIVGAVAVTMSASTCVAENSEWSYAASIYLFASDTKLGIGGVDAELSFSDAVANLDLAFMGAFEASNGRWSLLADYMMTDLSFENDTAGPAYSGLNASLKTQILSGYAAYRVYQAPKINLDLAAGFRWFNTKSDITLLPGISPGSTNSVNESWIDPLVGIRAQFEISEKWSGGAFVDYGGVSRGSETWQVQLTANYQINDNWSARLGYRHISVEHDLDGTDFSFVQSGPMFGMTYRF